MPEINGSATCSPQAELLSWSKGFSCSGVVGKDVVQLLQSAINKQEGGSGKDSSWLSSWKSRKSSQFTPGQLYHVEVVALMNDTVGTMMTCSMEGKPCEVAVVAGETWAPRVPCWWVLGVRAGAQPHHSCRQGLQLLLHGRVTPGGNSRRD